MKNRRRFLHVMALSIGTLAFNDLVPRSVSANNLQASAIQRSLSPNTAKMLLEEGNKRYQKGACIGPSHDYGKSNADVSKGPYAIIVTCSDARIVPELIFNSSPGSLVVIRNTGNLVDPFVLGSIELALKRFNIPILLVLSHEDCHAVQTAVKRFEQHGSVEPRWVDAIMTGLMPSVTIAKKRSDLFGRRLAEVAAIENARLQAEKIISMSKLVKERVSQGRLKVIYGHYHIDSGRVEIKS